MNYNDKKRSMISRQSSFSFSCMAEKEKEDCHVKKNSVSTFSGSNAACLALTIAVLKSLSEGTDVATTPRYFHAILAR